MNKLRELARETTSLSPIMDGREKASTDEIIKGASKGKITIREIDMVSTGKSEYPVMLYEEEPEKFYCGGIVLKKIVQSWIDYCGSIEKVNEMLAKEGVAVKLEEARTKDGVNNITKVTIL